MSAKQSKRNGGKTPANPVPAPVAVTPGAAAAPASTEATGSFVPWIESPDPKKRMWGKLILVGAWIYVAALWLLALDQTFHWGIFGPKIPPTP